MEYARYIPQVGDGSGYSADGTFTGEEVQLALRNRGLPLEALRYPVTPAGLHYLLIHYDIPFVEESGWRLRLEGLFRKPQALDMESIRSLPRRTMAVTMECAGNGRSGFHPRRVSQPWRCEAIGTCQWTGTPLAELLNAAQIRPDASEIVFTGADFGVEGGEAHPYQRSLSVAECLREDVLVAYEMNGDPLPPQHGFPLRLLVPGWYGMTSVKWLRSVEATGEPFRGYQMAHAYRFTSGPDDEGAPVDRIRVRSLMIPPGFPDYLTRSRFLHPGAIVLEGRAWGGASGIASVEVSVDGGSSWSPATLESPREPFAWQGWRHPWTARPGQHTLCVRAADSEGNVQPDEPEWNGGGYGNNAIQRLVVVVIEPDS